MEGLRVSNWRTLRKQKGFLKEDGKLGTVFGHTLQDKLIVTIPGHQSNNIVTSTPTWTDSPIQTGQAGISNVVGYEAVCITLKTPPVEVENSIQYYVERPIDYQDEVAKIIKATDAVKALVEENYTQPSHISKVAGHRRNG